MPKFGLLSFGNKLYLKLFVFDYFKQDIVSTKLTYDHFRLFMFIVVFNLFLCNYCIYELDRLTYLC